MIVLNLKTYEKSFEKALFFTDIAGEVVEETGVRIVLCPPQLFLREAAERSSDIFAQHVDSVSPGAFTGSIPAELLRVSKVKGSLVNHSEMRIGLEKVKAAVDSLHKVGLESLVCAESVNEGGEIASFSPTYIAVEPPELIGSGVSVSNAKPEIVTDSVSKIKDINPNIKVLCGAGVSNAEDVKKAVELGAEGVLLASAFVKAEDPKEFLKGLASSF
uniref:Triosephosphate isomerase n=1 Tax=Candidatus Methanophaga sp. ANME-1 ERB7 TaxID=2759913 RepID=A0A7G9Z2F5_9EURY|nr:triosephosphate isomerase [Methanosarcinales archaeon ANME-1 ERB7]